MNELINAAKAVIDDWNSDADNYPNDEVIVNLCAAVERAENPADFGFVEWFKRFFLKHSPSDRQALAAQAWAWATEYATQAERERCREIVITMGGPDVPELLRQIDSGED